MMTKGTRAGVATVVLLALLLISGSAGALGPAGPSHQEGPGIAAVVPPLLQYQGRLTHPSSGEPVDDGDYTVTFRLYDVESGGTPLWTETKDVSVQGGVFSTALGDTTALDPGLFNGQSLWLGTKVGADTEATPRQSILPVAYALSLVPGAEVSTTSSSAALRVHNGGTGDALQIDGATTLNGDLTVSGSLTGGSHAHSGEDITSGTLSNSRFSAYSDLSSEAYLNNDASGDLLTRSQADGRFVNEQQNSSITSAMIADGSTLDEILDDDGAGSGLDADLLDGLDASALRFITLDPYAAYLEGGATLQDGYGPYAGISIPDSGSGSFALGFTIPPDYIPGAALVVRLVWHTSSTSCGIELRPNFISVARAGRTHLYGGGVTGGFEAVGGTVLYAPVTANQSGAKEYTITSPEAGIDLEPFDSVIFGLYRCSGCSGDTCTGALAIQGVGVTY